MSRRCRAPTQASAIQPVFAQKRDREGAAQGETVENATGRREKENWQKGYLSQSRAFLQFLAPPLRQSLALLTQRLRSRLVKRRGEGEEEGGLMRG